METRQLLAGDFTGTAALAMGPIDARAELVATSSAASTGLTTQTAAEGEAAPDLVQFAKDLDEAGVIFYGANWCPVCTQQKQLFGDGGDDLPFVEVTGPDRTPNQTGIDNNIQQYPTWVFPDDSRQTGLLTLQELSTLSGVAIPQSEDPTFEAIGDQTVLIGSPLHIPVDAYDPNGGPLTVTVSVDNPSLLEASVVTGNRSIRIDMETYGDMIFELFEQRAPTATGRIIELAEDDFYDGIIFHRVIDNFVIQGGDPTGTGAGGSTLGDFDDDFHPELQHNRSGVLSFAKSSDDTNDSQFFVTEVPTRFLDFNHSVFGQLIEGDDVREAISEHAVDDDDRPTTDIAINTIEVFNDTENSLVMLKATGSGVGTTNVTITVTDSDGNSYDETFQVDVNNDTANSQPYLNEITVPDKFAPGSPATLQLSHTDIEGDAVTYAAQVASSGTGATATVSQSGLVTVTPAAGFTGVVDVFVSVRPGPGVTGNGDNDFDSQRLQFNFEGEQALPAPSNLDLQAGSDTGASSTDNITNAGTLAFTVDGVTSGAKVQLINVATSAVLGEATATGSSVTVTTNNIAGLGNGNYRVAARQTLGGEVSAQSGSIVITYDSTAPASVIGGANRRANVGRDYETDLISSEEGTIVYAFDSAPSGATINSGSGLIQWSPQASDLGDNVFTVSTTDIAGNTRTESFTVSVADEPKIEVKLVARDSDGNEITSLNVGDDFFLEFVGVDARSGFTRDGVYSLYADILFNSSIVRPQSDASIEYVGDFGLAPSGTFATGLIDELGAASTRTTASNEAESVIARVPMEAIASGSVNIRSEPADNSASEVLLFGEDDQVPSDEIFFGTLSLTVGLNFTLNDDTITVAEDSGATTIDVLGNDTTSGSSSLSVISVTQPASGGTVTVNSGVVRFTPDADFNGTATFSYRAGDGSGAQDSASVTVTVTPVNDPPTGTDDTFNVVEDSGANRLDVLANDSIDPDSGETLSVTAVSSSTAGATVVVSSDDGAVDYTPPTGFSGTDTFTYTVSDGQATSVVSVTVTVAPADAPPTAVDDAFAINEDAAEDDYDILQNDQRDTDNQAFVIDSVGTPSANGAVRISSDGTTFFYEPAENFFGTETVTYTIRDTGGGLSVGTVTFTVAAVNDAPPVSSPTIPLVRGSGETVVLALDDLPENVDGDSESLSFVNLGTPSAGGTVSVDSNGDIRYTPPSATFTGTDTVTFEVSDGSGTNSNGTLTIEIQEFTERDVTVRFSSNQAASISNAVRLTGTNAVGNPIDMTGELNDDLSIVFADLLPGQYQVEIPAIPFFSGAEQAQTYAINSTADSGDAVIDAAMGRLRPEFLSIQDWLGSTPAQAVLAAVAPGQSATYAVPTSTASDSISDPVVSMNDAGTSLTINGKDDSDADVTATVLSNDGDVVSDRGQVGDLRLFRINVASDALTYNPVSSSSTQSAATQLAGSSESETANDAASDQLPPASSAEGERTTGSAASAEPSDAVAEAAVTEAYVQPTSGLAAAGDGESEAASRASTSTDVSAPLLSSSLLAAAGSGEGEFSSDTDKAAESASDAESTPRLGRRRLLASGRAASSAPGSGRWSQSDQASGEAAGADSDDSSTPSALSADVVDRVFRRGL
ncbi:Ig-like domain-containing protein [Roseiconus nitratireducens]|uniref:Ig-like domain-containing protein n=1 Tax=Roseiconus nitratireducens TaxID=2605748 RepID=UPI001375C775|nr:tandem-95 repeat protein [Roseiconus nitratireducens]